MNISAVSPLRRFVRALTLLPFAGSLWLAASPAASAGSTNVAVAANFTAAAREIGAAFNAATGHSAVFSFGSTGQLYAQITQDAPFDVFLAADQARPMRAVTEGFAVPESRFTYATGKIVLFSKTPGLEMGPDILTDAAIRKIAIANPRTAPYGTAAVAALKALGLFDAVSPRIVQGNNIAQAYQFVETGNAEIGFVALSQIVRHADGARWVVPGTLYPAIAQDAVLLKRGTGNPAATAFIAFLKRAEAREIARSFGYGQGKVTEGERCPCPSSR